MEINEKLFDGIAILSKPHGDTDGDVNPQFGGHVPQLKKTNFIYPDPIEQFSKIMKELNVGKYCNIFTKQNSVLNEASSLRYSVDIGADYDGTPSHEKVCI